MAKSKFYAVRVGRKPGVYSTWDECRKHVDGYPRAEYKSFGSEVDAVAYVGATNQSGASAPALAAKRGGAGGLGVYYVIARGRQTGIFERKWAEIQQLVDQYPNALFQKFSTREAAEEFLAEHQATDLPVAGGSPSCPPCGPRTTVAA